LILVDFMGQPDAPARELDVEAPGRWRPGLPSLAHRASEGKRRSKL